MAEKLCMSRLQIVCLRDMFRHYRQIKDEDYSEEELCAAMDLIYGHTVVERLDDVKCLLFEINDSDEDSGELSASSYALEMQASALMRDLLLHCCFDKAPKRRSESFIELLQNRQELMVDFIAYVEGPGPGRNRDLGYRHEACERVFAKAGLPLDS